MYLKHLLGIAVRSTLTGWYVWLSTVYGRSYLDAAQVVKSGTDRPRDILFSKAVL